MVASSSQAFQARASIALHSPVPLAEFEPDEPLALPLLVRLALPLLLPLPLALAELLVALALLLPLLFWAKAGSEASKMQATATRKSTSAREWRMTVERIVREDDDGVSSSVQESVTEKKEREKGEKSGTWCVLRIEQEGRPGETSCRALRAPDSQVARNTNYEGVEYNLGRHSSNW